MLSIALVGRGCGGVPAPWLARAANAPLAAVDGADSGHEAKLVETSDLQELALRLRELTEDRDAASRMLELLALALITQVSLRRMSGCI